MSADVKLVCPMRNGEVCTSHPDFPKTCPPPTAMQGPTYCWLWVQDQRRRGYEAQCQRQGVDLVVDSRYKAEGLKR